MNLVAAPSISLSNAYNSKAIMIIEGHQLEYWIKTFSLPSFDVDHIEIQRTPQSFSVPGNIVKYGELSVSFFVDEYFNVYHRLYTWIYSAVNGPDYANMKTTGTIFVYNNQLTQINGRFDFSGMIIKGLPSISWNNYEANQLTLDISFRVDKFTPTLIKATDKNPK